MGNSDSLESRMMENWRAIRDSIAVANTPIIPTEVKDTLNNTHVSLLDRLIGLGVNQWNIPKEQIIENMDRIAYHESKNIASAKQIKGYDENNNPIFGKDMGLFQYGMGHEQSAWLATRRLNAILTDRNLTPPPWLDDLIKSNYNMATLNAEQQQILFMADKLKRDDNPMFEVDEPEELLNFWLEDHWQGGKELPHLIDERTDSFKDAMLEYDRINSTK